MALEAEMAAAQAAGNFERCIQLREQVRRSKAMLA